MGWVDGLRLPGRAVLGLMSHVIAIDPVVTASGRVETREDIVMVAVPELAAADDDLSRRLTDEVGALPGVAWVATNAVLGRIVVGLADPPAAADDVHACVAKVRAGHASDAESAGGRQPEPPGSAGALASPLAALLGDAAGLVVATAGRMAGRVPGAVQAASLITLVDTQPRLRSALQQRLGAQRADTAVAVANAAAQAVAGGVTGLAVDAALRVAQVDEAWQGRRCWRRHEARLLGSAASASAGPATANRPGRLPEGHVERYAPGSAGVGAVAAGVALATGGGPGRAAALAIASLPKAAGAGREAFACVLGRALAGRGALVMDRRVLRRLDRVDTAVLDVDALTTGRPVVSDVVALPGADVDAVQLATHTLFQDTVLDAPTTGQGWTLGPLDRLGVRGRTGAREQRRLRTAGALAVLGLARGTRLEAVVGVAAEPAHAADALIAAARRAGLDLILAGNGSPGTRPVTDRRVPGGDELVAAVRRLQAQGHGVLIVSRHRGALAQSDCGIGVEGHDGTPPWGAHVLVGDDLDTAALLMDATAAARTVSRHGVTLAEAGSAIGAVTTLTGRSTGASRRALLAVNSAAAVSMLSGVWAATELNRRPISPPVASTPWHLLPADKVLDAVDTTVNGLTTGQARRRYQPDPQTNPPRTGFLRAFAEELANPLTPVLAGGAALSAAIGSAADAGVVAGAAALGALVGSVQRSVTDRAVADLLAKSSVVATVRRDGEALRLPADDLVIGDVVVLAPGDVVPADCRLLEVADLEMDESSLTGESFPVSKTTAPVVASAVADRTSMAYEGTTVAAGRAIGVVVATGGGTEAGRGMATAQRSAPASGVEARLGQITRTTLPIALGSAGATMAAGLLHGKTVRQTVNAAVGLAVASVPEGLPFLVSAAQSAAARRLSRQGALVRSGRTIEALGRVDVLCFDKTGTLTQGRIRLAAISDGSRHRDAATVKSDDGLRRVLGASLRATPIATPDQPLPHLTDRAVTDAAADLGVERDHGHPGWRQTSMLPFEPSRGYHATLGGNGQGTILSVKGAPETVLPRCRVDAADQSLTKVRTRGLQAELHRLTGQGYRVLAVAERPTDRGELNDSDITGLRFLGFLGFADPVRSTAGASLRSLRDAGAQVVMITGDHPNTAATIAGELDILGGSRVITGTDLDALDDDALDQLLPTVAVVARGTPAHKVRVVQAFQRLGKVVAMTGDGANDAPAIRLADVGIALGRRGTPAARAAADLVVTDDRLETIVAALVEGRAMWRSARQALAILVGGNLGEIAFTVFGATLQGNSPLNARQLLLVNLLTDLAPALTVALRRPDANPDQLLTEGPQISLGGALTREISLRAGATATGAATGWLLARATGRGTRAQTVALAALVGSQLGQTALLGRRSPAVLAASVGSAATLAAVVQTPGISQFFGCTPLGPVGWAIAAGAATAASLGAASMPRLVDTVPPLRELGGILTGLDVDRITALVAESLSGSRLFPQGGTAR